MSIITFANNLSPEQKVEQIEGLLGKGSITEKVMATKKATDTQEVTDAEEVTNDCKYSAGVMQFNISARGYNRGDSIHRLYGKMASQAQSNQGLKTSDGKTIFYSPIIGFFLERS